MPVLINDIEVVVTPDEQADEAAPGVVHGGAEVGAHAPQSLRQAWQVLRDLDAEREARLAVD